MIIQKLPLSIRDIKQNLLNGNYCAVDLIDTYLDRIEKINTGANIFLTVNKEAAYQKAKKTDGIIRNKKEKAFDEYPLLGVVVAHKDLFLTKNLRTTAGSKLLADYIPNYSATAVERLDQAGAINIGKLNCDAWAHGSSGENSDFGPTKNPWNLKYTPGGSSSGSGAALASNLATITTGTDTCGSIRLPASYSYKVGLKSTYGAVSRYGVIAMASSLDCVGCLTHTVEDSQTTFSIIAGPDGHDATVTKNPKGNNQKRKIIGIAKEFFGEGLDSEVADNINEAVKIFEKLGYRVKEVNLPHTKYGIMVYYIIQPAEVSSNLARYDSIRYGEKRELFGSEAKRRIILGTHVLSSGYWDAYYLKAMKVRSVIRAEVNSVLDELDALIAPVAPTPPFLLGEKVSDPLKMYLTDIYAATANLSGIPSLAIPFGFSKQRLPLGFQLMGARFTERTLFDLAKEFHQEINFKPEFK